MSDEIEEKLKEAQDALSGPITVNEGEHVTFSTYLRPTQAAIKCLLEAGRLMDEQITLCQQVISLQNASIAEISARLKVVEELQGEIGHGEHAEQTGKNYG